MGKVSKEEKKGLGLKILEFKKSGLESYAAYLTKELENAEGKENKKAYAKYIQKEISGTDKKLNKVYKKLGIVGKVD